MDFGEFLARQMGGDSNKKVIKEVDLLPEWASIVATLNNLKKEGRDLNTQMNRIRRMIDKTKAELWLTIEEQLPSMLKKEGLEIDCDEMEVDIERGKVLIYED